MATTYQPVITQELPATGAQLSVVAVENLRKSFGSQTVLNGISLSVNRGETLAVLGRSGTGKSVLLRIIIGLIQPDDLESRALAHVIDVGLVGNSHHQHTRSVETLSPLIERFADSVDNIVGHIRVDFACQLDEAGAEIHLTRLPSQVKRIDGDTVTPQPRPRPKSLKAERLGRRRLDDLPNINIQPVRDELELIDQRDVDRPIYVFKQFDHLSRTGRRSRHDGIDNRAIQGHAGL